MCAHSTAGPTHQADLTQKELLCFFILSVYELNSKIIWRLNVIENKGFVIDYLAGGMSTSKIFGEGHVQR